MARSEYMYCTKCGKQINYDATVCNECAAAANGAQRVQQPVYQPQAQPQTTPSYLERDRMQKPKGSVMDGFGGALSSTLMSFFSLLFEYITVALFANETIGVGVLVFMLLVSLVLGVIALIKGIDGIKSFVDAGKLRKVHPIPALILGISGIIFSAISLIYSFVFLIALFGAL